MFHKYGLVRWSVLLLCLVLPINAYGGFVELIRNKPFISIWNVPSKVCEHSYGIKLNLSFFDIDVNSNESFMGNQVTIFYHDQLGLYPWINDNKVFVNGGIPQFANLPTHLYTVNKDVAKDIPDETFTGLAVIDWESWRPIFERNNYNQKQKVYVQTSEEVVRLKHPDWSDDKIYEAARKDFDTAARTLMQTTLTTCQSLRPGGFWGYYGFPRCFNYIPGQGPCSNDTRAYNDQLSWIFQSSSVIVPSIYLEEMFGTHTEKKLQVHGSLVETRRVKQKYSGKSVPVLPYTVFIYTDTGKFYDLEDLRNSIQQTAFFGFNGVSFWGSSSSFQSRDDCENIRDYVQHTLGPFVKNITDFMTNCSTTRCNSHGRCLAQSVDRDTGVESSLDTDDTVWITIFKMIVRAMSRVFSNTIFRHFFQLKDKSPYESFHCECFKGWSGLACDVNSS